MNWMNTKDLLPSSGMEVLTYYKDEDGMENFEVMQYIEEGEVIGLKQDKSIKDKDIRLLDTLLNKNNEIKAVVSGFYIYDEPMRLHKDIITHWCYLESPKEA